MPNILEQITGTLGRAGAELGKADWGKILPGAGLAVAGAMSPGITEGYLETEAKKKAEALLSAKLKQEAEDTKAQQSLELLKAGYTQTPQANLQEPQASSMQGAMANLSAPTPRTIQAIRDSLAKNKAPVVGSEPAAPGSINMPGLGNVSKLADPVAEAKAKKEKEDKGFAIQKLYMDASKEYIDTRDAYQRVLTGAKKPSSASDLSIAYNFIKLISPASNVREGQALTATNAPGVPNWLFDLINVKLLGNGRMDAGERAGILNASNALWKSADYQHEKIKSDYTKMAEMVGADPALAIIDLSPNAYSAPVNEGAGDEVERDGGAPSGTSPNAPIETDRQKKIRENKEKMKLLENKKAK